MKKLLNLIAIVLIGTTSLFAQTKSPTVSQQKPVKKVETKSTMVIKTPVKKDGTPDKRFKANKSASGPKKKDGTADMRYKANKVKKN